MNNGPSRISTGFKELLSYFIGGGRRRKSKNGIVNIPPRAGTVALPLLIAGVLGVAAPVSEARADAECGVDGVGADTIVCSGSSFPSGINYPSSDGLTLVLDNPDMVVSSTGLRNAGIKVASDNTTSNDIAIDAQNFLSITTDGIEAHGIVAQNSGFGDARVSMDGGTVATLGNGSRGLVALVDDSAGTGTAEILLNSGTITTSGSTSDGLRAENLGLGDAQITINGGEVQSNDYGAHAVLNENSTKRTASIVMTGGKVSGRYAGLFSRSYSEGSIVMTGGSVNGYYGLYSTGKDKSSIYVGPDAVVSGGEIGAYAHSSNGSAYVELDGGTVEANGFGGKGVWVTTSVGDAKATIRSGSIISGAGGNGSKGVAAWSTAGGDVSIEVFGGQIIMQPVSSGAYIDDDLMFTDGVGLQSMVTIPGVSTAARLTMTGGEVTTVADRGKVKSYAINDYITADNGHGAMLANGGSGDLLAEISGTAKIEAQGSDSFALYAGPVFDSGFDGVEVMMGTGAAHFTVAGEARLMGGRGEGGGIGLRLVSDKRSTIELAGSARVGSYSDRAIVTEYFDGRGGRQGVVLPVGATAVDITINDSATLTGTVHLAGGGSLTNNSGNSWNIRSFADTDGDFIRDTESVAISDFSSGPIGSMIGGTIYNSPTGVIRLLTVEDMTSFTPETDDDTAPTAWDTTGQYVAPGSIGHSIEMAGVEQGQFLGVSNFSNAGIITMADLETGGTAPVAGDVLMVRGFSDPDGLTVESVYTSEGGQLHLDTVLNDGVVDETDLLVLENAELGESGATTITITNARTGEGASTDTNGNGVYDDGEGILVVEVLGDDAISDAGAFTLAAPVIDGAWQYTLDQTDGQSWYLQSAFSPATPVYEAYPQTLLGLTTLPTMQQRIGNRWSWMGCDGLADRSAGLEAPAFWSRFERNYAKVKPHSSTTGSSYEQEAYRAEAGVDLLLSKTSDGSKLLGGLRGHYITSDTEVRSGFGDGKIETTGYGLGGSLTWLSSNGWYADAQGEAIWYDSDLSSDDSGTLVSNNDGFGYALSVEGGKKVSVSENWTVTPQAQLRYAKVDFDGFIGPNGEEVSFDDAASLKLRVGLALDRDCIWTNEGGSQRSHLYAIANIYREFEGKSRVDVSGTPLVMSPELWTGELGIGFTRDIDNESWSLYGEAAVATGLEELGKNRQLSATLGVRVKI